MSSDGAPTDATHNAPSAPTPRVQTPDASPPTPSAADGPATCPVRSVLDVLGGKWKILILWQLTDGALRYSQLRDRLDGVSDRMLAKQLRELEDDRLLARTAYAEVPPRVEYRLTDTGRSLTPHLNALAAWGAERLA